MSFGFLVAITALGCGGSANGPALDAPSTNNSSRDRLSQPAPVEKIDIQIGAQRSGHSLVVNVHGIGRGHQSGGAMEDSEAWHVTATHGSAPLKQVLAGPAKVSRAPTGAAMGDQWDVDVRFMIAFALPDRAGKVEVVVHAPSGEQHSETLTVAAPAEKLSLVTGAGIR